MPGKMEEKKYKMNIAAADNLLDRVSMGLSISDSDIYEVNGAYSFLKIVEFLNARGYSKMVRADKKTVYVIKRRI